MRALLALLLSDWLFALRVAGSNPRGANKVVPGVSVWM